MIPNWLIALCALAAACGGDRETPAPVAEPRVVVATADAAPGVPVAPRVPVDAAIDAPGAYDVLLRDPTPQGQALVAALIVLDLDTLGRWLRDAEQPRPIDRELPAEPLPRPAVVARDALVAWSETAAPLRVGCGSPSPTYALYLVARAGTEYATDTDEVIVRTALRVAKTLRDSDDSVAVAMGAKLAVDTAGWLVRRRLAPTAEFGALAPEPRATLLRRWVHALATCAEHEPDEIRAFVIETVAAVDRAGDASLDRVIAEKRSAAARARLPEVKGLGALLDRLQVLDARVAYDRALAHARRIAVTPPWRRAK